MSDALGTAGNWFCGLMTVASAAVHLSTFMAVPPLTMDSPIAVLHLGAMACGGLLLASLLSVGKGIDRAVLNRVVRASVPTWVQVGLALLMAYSLFNFITSMGGAGGTQLADGRYVISNHGKVVRELTREEYLTSLTLTLRGFSGHWLWFSAASLAGFLWARPALQDASARNASAGPMNGHMQRQPQAEPALFTEAGTGSRLC
jgi:hypothetical protein